MTAITIWQPWASLIAHGWKRYEFRSWKAPDRLIGERIAIHAAMRKPSLEEVKAVARADKKRGMAGGPFRFGEEALNFLATTKIDDYPRRVIIATAELGKPLTPHEVAIFANVPPAQARFCNWGWPLSDVHLVEPIPCKGRQGFWRVPEGVKL